MLLARQSRQGRRLAGEWRRDCATWVTRLNKTGSAVQKAIQRARSVADADLLRESTQHAARVPAATQSPSVITGSLRGAPVVQPPKEMFNGAMKAVRKLKPRADIPQEGLRTANLAARSMDTLMKGVTARLNVYLRDFPAYDSLHPFEKSLLDLSVGVENYARIVNNVDKLRKSVIKVGKTYAAKASRTQSVESAEAAQAEGARALEKVLTDQGKGVMWEVQNLSRSLRRVPQIDLYVPTIALIGAPNVGKSSLVTVLSSGTPEICNYPFTTRSVKMGHFYVNQVRHQVTDTPGLLYRADEERNAMEKLTIASLEHLPTAALFVFDLTEGCGCSVQQQWAIRSELLRRFPHKLWIDVVTKCDVLEEEIDAADEAGAQAMPGLNAEPRDAVQAIQWLPHACRVSAVTEEGLDGLKAAVLRLMDAETWAAQIAIMQEREAGALQAL